MTFFSDMEEDSERANFLRDSLSSARIDALLRRERKEAHIPDLRGVEV
jgi:hypothetical protein